MFAPTRILALALAAIVPFAEGHAASGAPKGLRIEQDEVRVRVTNPRRPLGKQKRQTQLRNGDLQNQLDGAQKGFETMSNASKAVRDSQRRIIQRLDTRESQLSNSDLQNKLQGTQKGFETVRNTSKAVRENQKSTIQRMR